jgi:two-component system sensor histidine kinase KdpD
VQKKRPNPDKLLQRAESEERQDERGKLKIYLGAAPGVGKTHEMLHDAFAERTKGLDVVIGVVESHGRQEIEWLVRDFEPIPQQVVNYHGKQLLEFDLNGALNRHPALILIDEMAHTNAPGLRHKKRWQDIKELLDRGIDVYTTLNIQHIESLNDHVAQIIHAPIKETIPDSMIELADTIKLIDIPPEELLKRLHEGKVYFPEQATLAAELFFRKGNLIALRELALRTTAERVGAQVSSYRQDQDIKVVWPTREKILVCVGGGNESLKLIRAAKRMASSLQSEWIAVYVDMIHINFLKENRHRAIQNLRLAEQLGAETRILTGSDIVNEVMNFAREQNVTLIMIWKHIRKRWQHLFFRSLSDEIIRHSGEIDVYIMTGVQDLVKQDKSQDKSQEKIQGKRINSWWAYGVSITVVGLATIVNFFLYPYFSASNLIMVYLLSVTMVALLGKMGPSILASVLSVLSYDYFFIPPFYHFVVTDIEYFFTLTVMLIVSQIISQLTILTQRQADIALLTEHQTSALYTLSRKLASTRGIDKLLNTGISYIASIFNSEVLALLPQNDHLVIRAKCRTTQELDEKEQGVAEWVYELGQMAGLGTDTLSFSNALYLPLLGSQRVIGVLRIYPAQPEYLTLPEKIQLLEACANQIALALEVDHLQEQAKNSELKIETDKARGMLLQSVSHDLRAPLVAIIGAASTQIEMAKKLNARDIEKLGKDIYLEAEQVSRLINNLLQITYLEAEKVKLQKKLSSLKNIITLVIQTSKKQLGKRAVQVEIPDDLPLIPLDSTLMQEVFINLIDNAIKFTPTKSSIEISVVIMKEEVMVSVRDHGPGIMPDEVDVLFEKFYRGRMLTEERGLGLGLAICRSIIKAHGGKIWAENVNEGGAVFRFTLPIL